MAAHNTLC